MIYGSFVGLDIGYDTLTAITIMSPVENAINSSPHRFVYIYFRELGLDNGMAPVRHQAIMGTKYGLHYSKPKKYTWMKTKFQTKQILVTKLKLRTSPVIFLAFCPEGN